MPNSLATALILALAARLASSQTPAKCNPSQKCPESSPCCSQYGDCGTGAYCLGGCDPKSSNTLDACVPAPVCKDQEISFSKDLKNLQSNQKYLGDASKADFVYSGAPQYWKNQKDSQNSDNVILTLSENGPNNQAGTLLASTHYMWYGKATATMMTSGGQGVVSAFILLGDSKDEIDFEFVGTDLKTAQTNFYSQGVTNYNNGGNASGLTDTQTNYHTYEIDWTPEAITWSIDNKEVRKQQRAETWNATANRYDFPQTPSRVQLSLWPAGDPKNAEGTVSWSGGEIQWNSPYMQNGYYYAAFSNVKIECYDPPQGANKQGDTSYIFTSDAMTNNTVEISDKETVLKSLQGTGTDMDAGDKTENKPSASTSAAAQVPGLNGVGADGNRGSSGTDSSNGGGSSAGGVSQPTSTGFDQGSGSNGSGSAAPPLPERVLETSLLAVVVALFALLVL